MNLSAEHIEGLATETGFRPEMLEKVIRLGELTVDVGRLKGAIILSTPWYRQ